jgi:putative nucleotidyltransferase with HDIG domain
MNTTADYERDAPARTSWILKDLPPYRPVARQLMALTSDQEVPLAEIQRVLRTDAAFTADVLRLANSPLIGPRHGIRGVMHAVMMLGLERIKSLATTLALKSFLTSGPPSDAMEACWRHNLATATICEKLAQHYQIDSDSCYTAGLLHDVGRLALLRTSPDEYGNLLSSEHALDLDLLKCERELFGADHCEAGRWVLEQWDFPKELCEVAALHHTLPGPGTSVLLRIVSAGWQIADLLGFSAFNRPARGEIASIASALPGNAGHKVVEQFDTLAEEVAFKINAMECSLV